MNALLMFSRAIDRVSALFGVVAEWLVLAAFLLSAGNAVVRYLFSISSNSLLEAQWYMFGGMVFFGAAHTLARDEHVRVDILYSGRSTRGKYITDLVGILLFLLPTTVFFTWLCWWFFLPSFTNGERSLNAGGLILWPAKLILPLGFFLLVVQGISELIKRIAALNGYIDLKPAYERPVQ